MSNGNLNDSLFESSFSKDQQLPPAPAPAPPQQQSPGEENNEPGKPEFMLRALVTSKEAGVIIGKEGKNVADMRDQTGVKAGVSKPVPGVQERVLTISGPMEGVVDAFSMAAQTLIDSPPVGNYIHAISPPAPPGIATLRLLISHQQMGTIIGRQGAKIKAIQEDCKVRMVASKEMLPQSTERVVEIQGTAQAARQAIWELSKCLLEDWERSTGSIPYNPQLRISGGYGTRYRPGEASSGGRHHHQSEEAGSPTAEDEDKDITRQTLAVPSDLVGCIIGNGGSKIQEIRRVSGARISIARQAHDSTGDRMFTITGSKKAGEKAIVLLYEQIDQEKARRG